MTKPTTNTNLQLLIITLENLKLAHDEEGGAEDQRWVDWYAQNIFKKTYFGRAFACFENPLGYIKTLLVQARAAWIISKQEENTWIPFLGQYIFDHSNIKDL